MATNEQSENQPSKTGNSENGDCSSSLSLEDRLASMSTEEKAVVADRKDRIIDAILHKQYPESALVMLSRKYVKEDDLNSIEAVDKAAKRTLDYNNARIKGTEEVLRRAQSYLVVNTHDIKTMNLDHQLKQDFDRLFQDVVDLLKERIKPFSTTVVKYKEHIAILEAVEGKRGLTSLRLAETSLPWYRTAEELKKATGRQNGVQKKSS